LTNRGHFSTEWIPEHITHFPTGSTWTVAVMKRSPFVGLLLRFPMGLSPRRAL
ncbi:hypothetical protein T4A_3734, partial [Trichinella pseudospiralis]